MKKKNFLQRVIIIVIVTIGSLYIVIGPRHRPTLADFKWSGIKESLKSNINLGLDLRGGSHLVMRVKVEESLKSLAENDAVAAQNAAAALGLPVKEARADVSGGNYKVIVEATDASKLNDIRDEAESKTDLGDSSVWTDSISGNSVVWTMTLAAQRTLSQQAVDQAYRIIDSRINTVGVAEPTFQAHGGTGSNQLLLQMPGIQDPERVKNLLIRASKLELVHVIGPPSPADIQKYASEQEAIQSLGGTLPSNRKVVPYVEGDQPTVAGEQRIRN